MNKYLTPERSMWEHSYGALYSWEGADDNELFTADAERGCA